MRLRSAVASVILLAGLLVAGVRLASAAPAPGTPPGNPRSVTLITGDRVTVGVDGSVTVAKGPGRAGIALLTRRVGGHVSVIPSDALPLLAAGRLDRRLFDVTQLLAFGYDDRRGSLPLVVTNAGVPAGLRANGIRALPDVHGYAMAENHADVASFWAGLAGQPSTVDRAGTAPSKVWLDGLRQPTLDVSVPQIGAPVAWAAGYTGAGQRVAVVDTGIDATHPDLAGKVVAEQDFAAGTEDGLDHVGHGTHVASTITGSGAASGGRYKGVAPGVRLVDAKVCVAEGCPESWILAGMQWAVADEHAKVVNMSLGGPDTPDVDPVEQAVATLTDQYGALFVVAAGNSGQDRSVASPASADAALAVGALTKGGDLAGFSSRGPRTGDDGMKPDISAPGVDITAARSKDGSFGTPGDSYVTLSGTSMAAPHVAGSAAILAQEHPDWTPAQLKAALIASANELPGIGVFGQGAGRVDVARAITQTVVGTPVSVSFGVASFPHDDDVPVTRPVSYHNDGATAVTLTLTTPSPVFSVAPSTVTVPAGGDATVQVTADTRVASPNGLLGADLTATGPGVVARTPLGVEKQAETYDLTLVHRDRSGAPTGRYDTLVENLDELGIYEASAGPDTVTLRLPRGRYVVSTILSGDGWTELVRPELVLDHAQTVVLDGSRAKPMTVTVPRAQARPTNAEVGFTTQQSPDLGYSVSVIVSSFDQLFSGQVGPDRSYPKLVSKVDGQYADPGPRGDFSDSPNVFLLTWFTHGRMVTGVTHRLRTADLATVRADFAAPVPGGPTIQSTWGNLPGVYEGGFAVSTLPFQAPFRRTEYYNEDPGLVWTSSLSEPDYVGSLDSPGTVYRAGCAYHVTWDGAVSGPTMPDRGVPRQYVWRTGDVISADLWLFGDAAGHLGLSNPTTARTTLSRNGSVLGQTTGAGFGDFTVPAGPARYRLETEVTRAAPFTSSTHLTAAWTFTSAHVSGTAPTVLPLSVVRFLPPVDLTGTAPKGRTVTVPVVVDRQAGSTATAVRTLTVAVAYDDGKTWTAVPVSNGAVKLRQPGRAGFVSLRATATDTSGNTVEETVIRAYRIA
jgi:subtilisin family serine protease